MCVCVPVVFKIPNRRVGLKMMLFNVIGLRVETRRAVILAKTCGRTVFFILKLNNINVLHGVKNYNRFDWKAASNSHYILALTRLFYQYGIIIHTREWVFYVYKKNSTYCIGYYVCVRSFFNTFKKSLNPSSLKQCKA